MLVVVCFCLLFAIILMEKLINDTSSEQVISHTKLITFSRAYEKLESVKAWDFRFKGSNLTKLATELNLK